MSRNNFMEKLLGGVGVDIAQLNAELKITVTKIDQLRKDIDAIVSEIEGEAIQA